MTELAPFAGVAPFLSDPLILIGFVVFLGFLLARTLLRVNIIPKLDKKGGFKIVRLLLTYGFVVGLVIIGVGGFYDIGRCRWPRRNRYGSFE